MKKFIALFIAVLMIAMLSMNVFAATGLNDYEKAVLEKLKTSQVVGDSGWSYTIPQAYINTAENYFAGDCEMTEAEMNKIISYIDQGMQTVKAEAESQNFNGKEYHLANMSDDARKKVLDLGQKACEEVELKLIYDSKEKEVVITAEDSTTPVFESAPIVKTTGEDFSVTAGVMIATVAAVLVMGAVAVAVITKKNGLLAK